MRRISYRLMIAILGFALGVSAVWVSGVLSKVEMIFSKPSPELIFTPTSRGCGCGWTQSYTIPDGRALYESSSGVCYKTEEQARQELQSVVDKASKIITRVQNSKNRHEEEGERIELLYSDESGVERAKILWHDRSTLIFEIDAPTLEIAHRFEAANLK